MKQILALLILFFSGCSPVDSEPEEYIDLASASPPASSVVEVEPTPSTPIAEEAPPAPVEEEKRPYVTVFIDPVKGRCPPCDRLKEWRQSLTAEQEEKLPFDLHLCTDRPEWLESYPTFYWETSDEKWWSYQGWTNIEDFIKVWEQSLSLSSSKKKDDITSQSEPSIANNSSPSSSASEQHSSGTAEAMPSSQSATASGSSFRKRRR